MVRWEYHIGLALFILSAAGCSSNRLLTEEAEALIANPEPLSTPITRVEPPPGSQVSLSNPADWIAYSEEAELCVEFQIGPLLEPGDSFELFENTRLLYDGREAGTPDTMQPLAGLALLLGEGGQSVANGPDVQINCWETLLTPGIHIAEFHLQSTSGAVAFTYKWAFQIDP